MLVYMGRSYGSRDENVLGSIIVIDSTRPIAATIHVLLARSDSIMNTNKDDDQIADSFDAKHWQWTVGQRSCCMGGGVLPKREQSRKANSSCCYASCLFCKSRTNDDACYTCYSAPPSAFPPRSRLKTIAAYARACAVLVLAPARQSAMHWTTAIFPVLPHGLVSTEHCLYLFSFRIAQASMQRCASLLYFLVDN
jgi:hypothetical protein